MALAGGLNFEKDFSGKDAAVEVTALNDPEWGATQQWVKRLEAVYANP